MARWILTLILALSSVAHADRPGTHGMLVLNQAGQVFLSHLPMFMSPHDYQAIFAADFGAAGAARLAADQAAHPEQALYTLLPEPFVLPDMAAHPRPFQATLYRGHFERGGVPIAKGLTVAITQVIYFHKLDPASSETGEILFGSPDAPFSAHVIGARPNFDRILEIGPVADPDIRAKLQNLQSVVVPWMTRGRELYLETGDLQ